MMTLNPWSRLSRFLSTLLLSSKKVKLKTLFWITSCLNLATWVSACFSKPTFLASLFKATLLSNLLCWLTQKTLKWIFLTNLLCHRLKHTLTTFLSIYLEKALTSLFSATLHLNISRTAAVSLFRYCLTFIYTLALIFEAFKCWVQALNSF